MNISNNRNTKHDNMDIKTPKHDNMNFSLGLKTLSAPATRLGTSFGRTPLMALLSLCLSLGMGSSSRIVFIPVRTTKGYIMCSKSHPDDGLSSLHPNPWKDALHKPKTCDDRPKERANVNLVKAPTERTAARATARLRGAVTDRPGPLLSSPSLSASPVRLRSLPLAPGHFEP